MISRADNDAILAAIAARRSFVALDAYMHGLEAGPHKITPEQWARIRSAETARRDELMAAAEIMGPS